MTGKISGRLVLRRSGAAVLMFTEREGVGSRRRRGAVRGRRNI
jgi:hypothetical protein